MAINAMHVAKTGLNAQQVRMQIISNNLANVNTNGFKRAISQNLISEDGVLAKKINLFIGYLESGQSKGEAAEQAGISQPIIHKLEALGR